VFTESTYSWTVLLHVTAALLLIGISIVQFHLTQAIRATSSASDLRTLVSLSGRASRAGPPFAIAALSTGVRLGSYGWWAQSWFHVAIGLWFVQAVLSTKVLRAHVRKLAAALKPSDVVMTPESDAICRSSAWLVGGAVMHGNDFGEAKADGRPCRQRHAILVKTRSEADRIAVPVGPGSFTGLRVGIAFAKGLALALDLPAVGIGTLEALAAEAGEDSAGLVFPAIDARRGEAGFEVFTYGGRTATGIDAVDEQ
jgi:hypothetical protein